MFSTWAILCLTSRVSFSSTAISSSSVSVDLFTSAGLVCVEFLAVLVLCGVSLPVLDSGVSVEPGVTNLSSLCWGCPNSLLTNGGSVTLEIILLLGGKSLIRSFLSCFWQHLCFNCPCEPLQKVWILLGLALEITKSLYLVNLTFLGRLQGSPLSVLSLLLNNLSSSKIYPK